MDSSEPLYRGIESIQIRIIIFPGSPVAFFEAGRNVWSQNEHVQSSAMVLELGMNDLQLL